MRQHPTGNLRTMTEGWEMTKSELFPSHLVNHRNAERLPRVAMSMQYGKRSIRTRQRCKPKPGWVLLTKENDNAPPTSFASACWCGWCSKDTDALLRVECGWKLISNGTKTKPQSDRTTTLRTAWKAWLPSFSWITSSLYRVPFAIGWFACWLSSLV